MTVKQNRSQAWSDLTQLTDLPLLSSALTVSQIHTVLLGDPSMIVCTHLVLLQPALVALFVYGVTPTLLISTLYCRARDVQVFFTGGLLNTKQ